MLSIFAPQEQYRKEEKCERTAKSQQFRLEIRRRQKEEVFRTVRKQLAQSLKNLHFLEELKSEKDNLTAKKISWVLEGLENGMNNANFYQQINSMNLEPSLCDVILNNEISFQHKIKILHSLVELTYFSYKIPAEFFDNNNLIDYFRQQLNKINLENPIDFDFTYYSSALIQNLTWYCNKQFNYYMMDSDLLPTIHKIISQSDYSQVYKINSMKIRQVLLSIYTNLFRSNYNEVNYIKKVLYQILTDGHNSQDEEVLYQTLKCLSYSTKSHQLWERILEDNNEISWIFEEIVTFIEIIHDNFSQRCFVALASFVSEIHRINQQLANHFVESFPQKFILLAFSKMRSNEQLNDTKNSICKTVKMISRIQLPLRQHVYRNSLEQEELIQNLMAKYILINPQYGFYAIKILTKILQQDKCSIDRLINHDIVLVVKDLLDCQFYKQEKAMMMDLIEELIIAKEDFRDKSEGGENKIVRILYERGIVKDIEMLQDHPETCIYKRAQKLMDKIREISRRK